MATCSETTETDIGAQNDADKLSASYLQTHPIIEYLGGIVVQAAQSRAELNLFSLSLEVVERWCEEAEKHCCYVTAGTFARRGLSSTAKTLRSLVWCSRF